MHAAAAVVHYNCLFASLVPVDTLYFHNHHALIVYSRLNRIGHVDAWPLHINRFDRLSSTRFGIGVLNIIAIIQ